MSLLTTLPHPRPRAQILSLAHLRRLMSSLLDAIHAHLRYRHSQTQQSRPLPPLNFSNFIYESFRKRHGLSHLVDNKAWDFISSLALHRRYHRDIDVFSSFLEGARHIVELSVFLHARHLIQKNRDGVQLTSKHNDDESYLCVERALSVIETMFSNEDLKVGAKFIHEIWLYGRSVMAMVMDIIA